MIILTKEDDKMIIDNCFPFLQFYTLVFRYLHKRTDTHFKMIQVQEIIFIHMTFNNGINMYSVLSLPIRQLQNQNTVYLAIKEII